MLCRVSKKETLYVLIKFLYTENEISALKMVNDPLERMCYALVGAEAFAWLLLGIVSVFQ